MEKAVYALLSLAFIVVLFLIFRGVTLWYFRINDIVKNLEAILAEIKKTKGVA